MSKSVVLVLEPRYESEYGEYTNTPIFNAHGDIIGWTGGEVPEFGYPCEFNALNDEGFTTCVSSTMVNKLRGENAKLRELVDAWMGCGTRYHTMKGGCPMFDENAKDFCKAEEMARELGIEVG